MSGSGFGRCLLALLAAIAAPPAVRAQVVTSIWSGTALTGTGNWSNAAMWSTPPQTGYNVTINPLELFPSNVTLDVNATINQLTLGSGATLTIANGQRLQVNANSLIDGTLTLNATGSAAELYLGSSGVILSGTGTLVMSANSANRIRGAGSGDGLVNQITISGGGSIGNGTTALVNQGTIVANNSFVPLVIQTDGNGMTNTGTLRSTAGATLVLDGLFNNAGGSMVVDNGSHLDLDHSTINGGVLSSTGTGHFHVINSAFSDVAIASGTTIEVANSNSLTLLGNVTNNGLIAFLSTGSHTDLKVEATVTISGTGNITLTDSRDNRFDGNATSVLTIGSGQIVSGAGLIGRNNLALVNQGIIHSSLTAGMEIDVRGTSFTNHGTLKTTGTGGMALRDATVTNLGTVEVGSGSSLTASGNFTQSGSSSVTRLVGGTFTAAGFSLQDGALAGTGSITGTVASTGTSSLIPGGLGSIGTLTFNSTLNLGSTSSVLFDLGGLSPGTGHDRINGTSVFLNGTLSLAFTNGFESTVTASDTLTLINASTALNGTFASLANGARLATADGLGSFQVNYFSNTLTLSNFQPIPEPSTYVLLTIGAAGALLAERRRRRRAHA